MVRRLDSQFLSKFRLILILGLGALDNITVLNTPNSSTEHHTTIIINLVVNKADNDDNANQVIIGKPYKARLDPSHV